MINISLLNRTSEFIIEGKNKLILYASSAIKLESRNKINAARALTSSYRAGREPFEHERDFSNYDYAARARARERITY